LNYCQLLKESSCQNSIVTSVFSVIGLQQQKGSNLFILLRTPGRKPELFSVKHWAFATETKARWA
jgi:hypothetical protein